VAVGKDLVGMDMFVGI